MKSSRIILVYPPEYDGELYIDCADNGESVSFRLTYARKSPQQSPADLLRLAATDILQRLPASRQQDINIG
jgi:hypothetical protein